MKKIVLDMDGVLADFFQEQNYMERFENEKGFFKKLKPISNNYKWVQRFIDLGFNVYVLSSSPHDRADKEKRAWLKKYIPNLSNDKIIFCRNGEDKADYMTDLSNAILIDDHTPNLIKWKIKGGKVIKYLNNINSIKGVHKILRMKEISNFKDLPVLLRDI